MAPRTGPSRQSRSSTSRPSLTTKFLGNSGTVARCRRGHCGGITGRSHNQFFIMPILRRDYETRSTLDLREVGVWQYATHPTTDVWCCGLTVDDDLVRVWRPGDPVPPEWIEAARNPEYLVAAFNDGFERQIEQHIMRPRYGWPEVPLERHRCSQAAAAALALPASLEAVAD